MTNTLQQLRDGQLAGARQLKLACGLTEFPREIFDLADTLEVLDLSGNALSSLPDDLPRLKNLRIIFASDNQFTELPEVLGQCAQLSMVGFKANRIRRVSGKALPAQLRWLILTDNEIDVLPAELGECLLLQKLMLAGNRLRSLPVAMAACSRLELLRLAANQLTALPEWLLRLPRLSWLAYAGNPFSESLETKALIDTPIDGVHWDSLQLEQKLGEGASGIIYQALLRGHDGNASRRVAVKLFKGAVTSDGLPDCEMAACIRAGDHSNLIPVVGRIHSHPTGAHGLVMELIDPEFRNLAGPPSLASCTRDVYDDALRFDQESALRLVRGVASAACHLHQQGVMHGDLYAHNILHCGQGRALLGDFGAASFFPVDDRALALRLQRIEVRAFGCLLEEVAARSDVTDPWIAEKLTTLMTACLHENAEKRPPFEEIVAVLAG